MSERGPEQSAEPGAVLERLVDDVLAGGAGTLEVRDVLDYAVRLIPHADHAGVTLVRGRTAPQSVVTTSEVAAELDAFQYETGEGPCFDALSEQRAAHCDDLLGERRWPALIACAVEKSPVRSMLGIALRLDAEYHAALTLYSESPGAMADFELPVVAVVATHLSVLLQRDLAAQTAATLDQGLGTARQIGAAMGILMARQLLTFDEAFDRMRAASQRLHRKLRDVALEVIERGELPG